jgi:hypothetical protein
MGTVPLDVQRRCERRWAARFSRRTESVAPRNPLPEKEGKIAGPEESKGKTFGVEAVSSRART